MKLKIKEIIFLEGKGMKTVFQNQQKLRVKFQKRLKIKVGK